MKTFGCFICGVLVLAGCATGPRRPAVILTGNILVDGPAMMTNGPPKDRVLWEYRTAAAALRVGQFQLAQDYLDDVLLAFGGSYGSDKAARQARSLYHAESKKFFIGEPYERVMAFFYRGVLYWMNGEPDNARACFLSAQLQDTGTDEEQYSADYAILDYLVGVTTLKMGGDGADAFQRAEKESKLSKLPPYDARANVFFVLEFGPGPVKFATGEYSEQLHFRAPPSPVYTAAIRVNNQTLNAGPCDDLQFQATTRGGRVMDHVLGNKAKFKSTTDTIGNAAMVAGAIAASQHDKTTQQVGWGLLAAGVATKLFSSAATPSADVRSWDNLPRYLTFATLALPAGTHTATIEFHDPAGRLLPNLTKTITIDVPADGKEKVVFVSDQSLTPQTI